MAKIRLTKNELKKQKDDLKRFTRYLPTLELKKKQLLQEIRKIQNEIDRLQAENKHVESEISEWVDVFAEEVSLRDLIQIDAIETGHGNIAGIDIPVFESMSFADVEYDFILTPLWVDAALIVLKEQLRRRVEWEIAQKQQEIIRDELRITIQRIKLFEEVKIPEAREHIRVIQIFLGDLQTAEVVRGKIAKTKIQKKKEKVVAV
jgi:V/A-type H+-transporting ATPase subunit D